MIDYQKPGGIAVITFRNRPVKALGIDPSTSKQNPLDKKK